MESIGQELDQRLNSLEEALALMREEIDNRHKQVDDFQKQVDLLLKGDGKAINDLDNKLYTLETFVADLDLCSAENHAANTELSNKLWQHRDKLASHSTFTVRHLARNRALALTAIVVAAGAFVLVAIAVPFVL